MDFHSVVDELLLQLECYLSRRLRPYFGVVVDYACPAMHACFCRTGQA